MWSAESKAVIVVSNRSSFLWYTVTASVIAVSASVSNREHQKQWHNIQMYNSLWYLYLVLLNYYNTYRVVTVSSEYIAVASISLGEPLLSVGEPLLSVIGETLSVGKDFSLHVYFVK